MVLDVDEPKRRISLGLKQAQGNPWELFVESHPPGSDGRGRDPQHHRVRPVRRPRPGHRRHGPHVRPVLGRAGRGGHGQATRRARPSRPRCSTSTSRRSASRSASSSSRPTRPPRCSTASARATSSPASSPQVQANGIEVKVEDVLTGFIRRAELARDRGDQRPDRFAVGEKVDAKVTAVDRAARRLALTIKGKEIEEEQRGDGGVRLVRLRRLAGRHPGRGDPPPQPAGPVGERLSPVSLETDLLLDRRRLKRRLVFWRSFAVLAVRRRCSSLAWRGERSACRRRHVARLTSAASSPRTAS